MGSNSYHEHPESRMIHGVVVMEPDVTGNQIGCNTSIQEPAG